jgi:hypothetical protein
MPPNSGKRALILLIALFYALSPRPDTAAAAQKAAASAVVVTINVDAAANRHPISPLIYGTNFATTAQLLELNSPLNRQGGNATTRYNWQLNAANRANDWYYESIGYGGSTPGEDGDTFIQEAKDANAEPMLTIPVIDWISKIGPNREKLASFSIATYGAQTGNDWQWFPDAGNGILTSGQYVTGNDKNDANMPNSVAFQQGWVDHLIGTWGTASDNGVKYYLLDNESSIWFATHRDVQPVGTTMEEMFTRMRDFAAMIKSRDPEALVVGPEEWGWGGFIYSGYDQWYAPNHNWQHPDRAAHGDMDYAPWLLQQFKAYEQTNGQRILDVFTLHYYPQGGETDNGTSTSMQLRRNRSTRSLWDPNYTDESWINDKVRLVPRMKDWVAQYYPGTKTGVTEYNWGAEDHINGATAQADIFGIFGNEGLDIATRWTTPATDSPTFKAMKMYRNYDSNNRGFGETSVAASAPDPDSVSAFASVRTVDGALTVMVINKVAATNTATINLANFDDNGISQVWQLTSANQITRLADVAVSNGSLNVTLPAQSITLFVIGADLVAAPTLLTGSRVANSISLTWQDNAADEDGFVIERAAAGTANFAALIRVGPNRTSLRKLAKFGGFTYRVRAIRNGSLSAPSNTVDLGNL